MSKTYYLSVKYKDLLGDCGNVKCGQYLYNVQEDLFVEKVKKLCK